MDAWAPVASANNVVMVFPKARVCWNNLEVTKVAFEMRFLKQIIDNMAGTTSKVYEGPPRNKALDTLDRIA